MLNLFLAKHQHNQDKMVHLCLKIITVLSLFLSMYTQIVMSLSAGIQWNLQDQMREAI